MPEFERHFDSRVLLPFDHVPRFPTRCLGCDRADPEWKWSPPRGNSPFTGKTQYFDNNNMLPLIEIPVCNECITHMPGQTHEWSNIISSYFAPLLFVTATILFYIINFHAVAVLTGAAALIWIVLATQAVWVVSQSTLFDLKVGKHESLIYYFRDEAYGKEFALLNQ